MMIRSFKNILFNNITKSKRKPFIRYYSNDKNIKKSFSSSKGGADIISDNNRFPDLFGGEKSSYSIRAYTDTGFVIDNDYIEGPICLFGDDFFSWNIKSPKDINIESLTPLWIHNPTPHIIVLGTGENPFWLDDKTIKFLRDKGIGVEMLSTASAISTYNFLRQEERTIAGAFIPNYYSRTTMTDPDDTLYQYPEYIRNDLKKMISK